jgi:hypothetical protein
MSKANLLKDNETIVNKDQFDRLWKFAKWCLSSSFDSRDIGIRAADALKEQ